MIKTFADMIFGIAVGDAVGVPHEFKSREKMDENPAVQMDEFGTHNQPLGTWSDDTSMALCLAEAMTEGYSLENVAKKFIDWRDKSYWTPHGEVFDIGNTTYQGIESLKSILETQDDIDQKLKDLTLNHVESQNGNGVLMRIMPLVFMLQGAPIQAQYQVVLEHNHLTHRHNRSAMACMILLKYVEFILKGADRDSAYRFMQGDINYLFETEPFDKKDVALFNRVLKGNIFELPEDQIKSGGYVIDTLEASLWCVMNSRNYKEAVLKAVNLGEDTDTTGAVTGGLSGLIWGLVDIPTKWTYSVARDGDIRDLITRFEKKFIFIN